jgi:DNA invertase Pin-like site-specific DNA recombinase
MLDGYIRVSQVAGRSGESFISPAVQREQIEAWAAAHGEVIGEMFEELDESGARADRPMLLCALKRIEAGVSSGLVVAKLDRFGRSVRDGIATIERIQAAKGTVISVQDGLDLGTETGKLVFHILLSMGEWELDRIRSSWETARARAIARGVHVGSTVPFGYQRDTSGRLRVDPETGPVVTEMFRRRAEGAMISELGRWLESQQIRTARNNPGWCDSSLRQIMKNRVYLGELRSGDHVARGRHEALVQAGEWQRAQRPRPTRIPNAKSDTLLGGLLRCASCRRVLHSRKVTASSGRRVSSYFCHPRSSQGVCEASAYALGPKIEPFVEEVFFGELFFRERSRTGRDSRLPQLCAELRTAEQALDNYRDRPRLLEVLGEERYVAGLQVRRRAIDRAMQRVASEERRVDASEMPAAAELEEHWPSLTVRERRSAIGALIDCVFVGRGWGHIADRSFVYCRGEEPLDLPVRGSVRAQPPAFDVRELNTRRLRRPPQWSKTRIREALRTFLAGRAAWPPPEEFTSTGYGVVYAQVIRTGGPEHWAMQLGVSPPKPRQGIRAWNRELAERTLRNFTRGRKSFPTQSQFGENGYKSLYAWLQKHGGMPYWAAELDLPRTQRSIKAEQRMRRHWARRDPRPSSR